MENNNFGRGNFPQILKSNFPNSPKNARKTEYDLQPILRKSKTAKIKMAVVLFYRQGFWEMKNKLKSQRQISKNPDSKFVKFMLKNS